LLSEEGIDPAAHDFSGGKRPFDLDEYYKIITPSLVSNIPLALPIDN
jgi:hypothetical protein